MTTTYSSTKYCGHKGPILCLDVSPTIFSSSSLLLSGSEDRTARIWDLRTCCGGSGGSGTTGDASGSNRRRPRASLCIPTKGEVLSAVFATTRHSKSKALSQPSSAYDHTIYLGVNNTVLEYDLRQHTTPVNWTATTTNNNANTNPNSKTIPSIKRRELKSPIWMDPPTNNLYQVLQNEEEVNQISTTSLRRSCRSNSNISINTSSCNKKKRTGGNKKNSRKSKTNKNKSKNHAEVFPKDEDDEDLLEEFFVAACDDSGTVRITSSLTSCELPQENIEEKSNEEQQDGTTNHQTQTQILQHDPDGIAVVSSCAFRPSTMSAQLISGGMDCKVHLWNLISSSSSSSQHHNQLQQQQIRKPLCSVSVQQQQQQQQGSSAQAVNPPMVHSLSWSPSGQYFAAGLGNGNVNLYTVPFAARISAAGNRRNNEIVQIGQLADGHSSSVVSVLYPEFGHSTETDQFSSMSDRVLCSAGSDGKILFWDLSTCLRGDVADDLDSILAELDVSSNIGSNDDKKNGGEDEISKLFAGSLVLNGRSKIADARSPSVLFQIDHQEKINWVTKATMTSSSCTTPDVINDTIFVADTSNDITSYKIPLA